MTVLKELSKVKNNVVLNFYNLKGYKIIYPPQGLGDILILLRGLKLRKENNPNEKIAIIISKKHFKDLCLIFKDSYDKIIYLPSITPKTPKFVLNIVHLIYGNDSHIDKFDESILNAIGVQKIDNYLPKIEISEKTDKLFEQGIFKKGKTVLIAPEATTSRNCFSPDFWLDCADKLAEKGYIPVFNSKEKFGKYQNIFFNLSETINFVNKCGNVLAFRSGLTDVLGCFCNANFVIIYPNNWKPGDMPYLNGFDENPNERYLEDGSLNRLFPNKHFNEFIYNENIDATEYFMEVK